VTQTYYAEETRPRKRRGRRALITLLIVLIVIAGLLFAADRVAANFAEKAIADQVAQEAQQQGVQSSQPRVDVGGFPFLTQVLEGNYEEIGIVLNDVRGNVDGRELTVPELDVVARDVKASLETLRTRQGDVVATSVEGTGTISYASVAELVDQPGLELTERNGQLVATAPVELLGQRFTLTGAAELTVAEGQIQIRFRDVQAEGLPDVPAAQRVISGFAENLGINVELPDLPFRLDVQSVEPTPDGLLVTATAQNVPING
jgi:hypothetical protein